MFDEVHQIFLSNVAEAISRILHTGYHLLGSIFAGTSELTDVANLLYSEPQLLQLLAYCKRALTTADIEPPQYSYKPSAGSVAL